MVKASAQAYHDAQILAAPMVLNFVLISQFLGQEQSGKVLLMSIVYVGNGASIIFDNLFIVR